MAEETPSQDQQTQEQITQKVIAAPDLPLVYTNSAQVWSSFFDFRIVFSEGKQTGPSEITTTAQVAVVMSPEHAKALADALNKTIEQYETQFGKLRPIPTHSSAIP